MGNCAIACSRWKRTTSRLCCVRALRTRRSLPWFGATLPASGSGTRSILRSLLRRLGRCTRSGGEGRPTLNSLPAPEEVHWYAQQHDDQTWEGVVGFVQEQQHFEDRRKDN